jgi:hypothetical protein
VKGRHAEVGGHGVRQSPAEHLSRMPVHDRDQVPESFFERDVGDVGCPHLVGPVDDEFAQQVGVDRLVPVGRRSFRLWAKTSDPHEPHQTPDPFAIDDDALTLEDLDHHPLAVLGVGQVELVDREHEGRGGTCESWVGGKLTPGGHPPWLDLAPDCARRGGQGRVKDQG